MKIIAYTPVGTFESYNYPEEEFEESLLSPFNQALKAERIDFFTMPMGDSRRMVFTNSMFNQTVFVVSK